MIVLPRTNPATGKRNPDRQRTKSDGPGGRPSHPTSPTQENARQHQRRDDAQEFEWLGEVDPRPKGVGFYYLDHLTHNVKRGNMDKWFGFYAGLFNFRQIRFFDIEGRLTGLYSRALTSPCGRIRIPINE